MSQPNPTSPANPKFPGNDLSYADFSDAVADLLERGWTQGHFVTDENDKILHYRSAENAANYCAVGAIYFAAEDHKISLWHKRLWLNEFKAYLNSAPCFTSIMGDQIELEYEYQLFMWNDNEAQSKDNTVSAFRDFAAYLRSLE